MMSRFFSGEILSIEKLNLTWNKQTNVNKLRRLPRVFQIELRGRGMVNFPEGAGEGGRSVLSSDEKLAKIDFDQSNNFQN